MPKSLKLLEGRVSCPRCGFDYLTHVDVHVWDRKEDADSGMHVQVLAGNVHVDSDMSSNPSERRHGLSITFLCDGCSYTSEGNVRLPEGALVLDIVQHKGVTTMKWRDDE